MPQYRIPQKAQREDKIVGPFTGRQLVYGITALGSSYLFFNMVNLNPIFWFNDLEKIAMTIPVLMFGLAFAFVEYNERTFEILLANFIRFLTTPKIRVWQKENTPPAYLVTPAGEAATAQAKEKVAVRIEQPEIAPDLTKLSNLLDKPEQNINPAPSGPTSKTLELLEAVKGVDREHQPLSVIAKSPKGLSLFIKKIVEFPTKILMGNEAKSPPKPASQVSLDSGAAENNPEHDQQDLEEILSMSASGQKTATPPEVPSEQSTKFDIIDPKDLNPVETNQQKNSLPPLDPKL